MTAPTCTVGGCQGRPKSSGARLCQRHWELTRPPCATGCGKPATRRELCRAHAHRLHRYGDPLHGPRAGTPTYSAVHQRLQRYRGRARTYPCRLCGGPAAYWAFTGGGQVELIDAHRSGCAGNPTSCTGTSRSARCHAFQDAASRSGRCRRADARTWLAQYAREHAVDGVLNGGAVIAAAADAGIDAPSVYAARRQLGIDPQRHSFGIARGSRSTWRIPPELIRSSPKRTKTGAA